MKNTLYFLLFTAMATFISCSENEQPPEEELSLVVGEWYVEDISIKGTMIETKDGPSMIGSVTASTGADENSQIIFKNDNTYSRVDNHSLMIHTHFVDDSSFELVPLPYMTIEGTYEIQGDQIKYTAHPNNQIYGRWDPRDTFEGTILELTANKIVIVEEHQEIINFNGAEYQRKYQMTQIFSK